MKRMLIYCSALLLLLSACSKADNPVNNRLNVRYEFTATLAGNFGFQTITATEVFSQMMNTASWSKTVSLQANNNASDSAKFTVTQPADWAGTTKNVDVTLKIFVNDVEKGKKTSTFVGADRPNPVELFIKL